MSKQSSLSLQRNLIAKDDFVNTEAFKNYEKFRKEKRLILNNQFSYDTGNISTFKKLNSEFWETYYFIGKYYYEKKYYKAAQIEFEKALSKEVTTKNDKERIEQYLKKIKRKLK